MKKIFIAFCFLMGAGTMSTATAQIGEGTVMVEGYYGFPNLYSSVFRAAYANAGGTGLTIKGYGPLGLRAEYLLADKVGVGIDIGSNGTSITYQENTIDANGNAVTYDYRVSTMKVGVMATVNYHFVTNDNLDFYGMFGAGYGTRNFKSETNDPNFQEQSIKGGFPVASRLGIGVRYFFIPNLGANLNLGFGQGGIMNAGLTFKL